MYLGGSQRPPAPPKEPPSGGKPKQPTPGPSSGGGGGGPWRGLEFKFTPGDKNPLFNNRTGLAILVGGSIAAYFAYNNTLYREITWKDFVSLYLLKGYVR